MPQVVRPLLSSSANGLNRPSGDALIKLLNNALILFWRKFGINQTILLPCISINILENTEIFWRKLLWFLYLSRVKTWITVRYDILSVSTFFLSTNHYYTSSRDHAKIKPKRIPQKTIRFYCISNCILKDYSDGVIFIFDECKYFLRDCNVTVVFITRYVAKSIILFSNYKIICATN